MAWGLTTLFCLSSSASITVLPGGLAKSQYVHGGGDQSRGAKKFPPYDGLFSLLSPPPCHRKR